MFYAFLLSTEVLLHCFRSDCAPMMSVLKIYWRQAVNLRNGELLIRINLLEFNMKLSFRLYSILIFFIIAAGIIMAPGCSKKEDTKNNAALINGKPITRAELANEMNRIKQRFYQNSSMNKAQTYQIENEVLEILIGGQLLFQASEELGIKVSAQEIKEELEKAKENFSSDKNTAVSFTENDIRKKLSIEQYITKEFSDKTVITNEQGKDYYQKNIDDFTRPEQVLAAHILIKSKKDDDSSSQETALNKIKMVQEKLNNGSDFSELAKEYSEDASKSLASSFAMASASSSRRLACEARTSALEPAARPTTVHSSARALSTSSVLRPMEPVDPNTITRFFDKDRNSSGDCA